MIKENVLRKNLLTNEIDYGNVDSEFESINLKAEDNNSIIYTHPYIELSADTPEYKQYFNDKILSENKYNKLNTVYTSYSDAQFAIVDFQGLEFKVSLRGVLWSDFESQMVKAMLKGEADLADPNTDRVLRNVPLEVLKPLFNQLSTISVSNFLKKKEYIHCIENVTDIVDIDGNILKTASEVLDDLDISFPEIQTLSI